MNDLNNVVAMLWNFISNRNVHKAAGTAYALLGAVSGVTSQAGLRELIIGGAYAGLMHITGGIKSVPDNPVITPTPVVAVAPVPPKPTGDL